MTRSEWGQSCFKNVFSRYRFYLITSVLISLVITGAALKWKGSLLIGIAVIFWLATLVILFLLLLEWKGIQRMTQTLPESLGPVRQLNTLWLGEDTVYFWYRRQGHVIPIQEIMSCSVASVTESPYASGSARNGMMILGLKDRNLGVNVSDRKNAIQAAQFLKTKNPRLPLTDIEEKKVSLTEIHDEK